MKKLTPSYRVFLLTKSAVVIKKRNRLTKLVAKKKQAIKSGRRRRGVTTIKIFAPENFVLGYMNKDTKKGKPESRGKLLHFIHKVKNALAEGMKVHVSFKDTKLLAPSGTLIFVAEIEKILGKYPGKISIDYPNDDVVEQLFQHIGLLERLGLTPRKSITAENVRHWSYVYGTTVDTTAFISLFAKYSSNLSEDVRSGLFEGMSEAVTNSIQHAYPCEHSNGCNCEKGWWMFSKQTENILTVVMYDTGIGIPASLKNKPEFKERLAAPYRRYKKRQETMLIDIAVESNRTSTRLPHRGKGLPDMLEFVKEGHVGEFKILSGAGAFSYTAQDQVERGRDFEIPVGGTLIQWELPITVLS